MRIATTEEGRPQRPGRTCFRAGCGGLVTERRTLICTACAEADQRLRNEVARERARIRETRKKSDREARKQGAADLVSQPPATAPAAARASEPASRPARKSAVDRHQADRPTQCCAICNADFDLSATDIDQGREWCSETCRARYESYGVDMICGHEGCRKVYGSAQKTACFCSQKCADNHQLSTALPYFIEQHFARQKKSA
jgi:hypothetical protein